MAYAQTRRRDGYRWLDEIAVDPAHRGRGHATRLLNAARAHDASTPLRLAARAFVPDRNAWDAPGLTDEQLAAWYARHGARPTPTASSDRVMTVD
ncbi:GNAT family N-acetyltransferase [Streptomyces althioticus]|uniref:GNAT family N-acetyltransferase n=1 Tax=Streptomyces althioticus TaxID=83380 RepID=UPI0034066C84